MSTAPLNCFTTNLDVRWSDQDVNGHVNNANAVTLLEEARVRASMHWSGSAPGKNNPRVVRAINVVFDAELAHAQPLSANIWVSRIGGTSFTIQHELIQNDTVCVTAEAVIVVLDRDTRKPAAIPDLLRTQLSDYYAPASV
ncbi:MAG: thioesterase family protein [Corynebacterium sp.]|uniref:acyl-CoA thioesterase n=1 Tax=Corynebacterium sp. TaxID=1720 RepID=UPI0026DFF09E|nr:thioesterase family protein [Corynebacterium sp.]MDO5670164.1 thioesterase family protein [Corynebacterium sp.]